MYSRIERKTENKSRSFANFKAQKNNCSKDRLVFLDNRPESVAQLQLQSKISNSLIEQEEKDKKSKNYSHEDKKYPKNSLSVYGRDCSTPIWVIQRAGTADQMWDDYFEAYDNLMSVKKNTNTVVDLTWRNRFYHLENLLYQAKDPANPTHYNDANVQDAHTQLMLLGVLPPAPQPNPNMTAARALIIAANARWAVFRGNYHVNRGAWAGSASHGPRPADYVQTPAGPIQVIRDRKIAIGEWWIMASDSAPSGCALHRRGFDARGDFIYHL